MGNEISPTERCLLKSIKMKGDGDLNSTLTSDKEMQRSEFGNLGFICLVFDLHFGTVMYNLCHVGSM